MVRRSGNAPGAVRGLARLTRYGRKSSTCCVHLLVVISEIVHRWCDRCAWVAFLDDLSCLDPGVMVTSSSRIA
jgi:hypothetical protein